MAIEEQMNSESEPLKPLSSYDMTEVVALVERAAERVGELEAKYWSLCWYAKRNPDDPRVQKAMAEIKAQYPAETAEIVGDYGDWQHGFNNGILAASRQIGAYLNAFQEAENVNRHVAQAHAEGIEEGPWIPYTVNDVIAEAEDEFPFLDT